MHEILQNLSTKRPNSEIFKITTENWKEEQFDGLLSSQGLFEQKYIVVLDFLFEQKDIKEKILDNLEKMQSTEHWFLVLEGKIDVASAKKIEKASYKTQEFEKKETKKESPAVFSITDELLKRDKKKMWIRYVDLINQKVPPEEIHGIIFWAVKNMIIASRADSQKDSGLSPFVYKNSLSGSRNYKLEELQKMAEDLVEMVHKVRTGEGDMEEMLEKWMLGV